MTKIKVIAGIVLVLAVAFIAPAVAQQNNVISIGDVQAAPGESITAPISINTATGIAGIKINLSYNPAVVNITDYTVGDFNDMDNTDISTAQDGYVVIWVIEWSGLSGDKTVANVELTAVGSAYDSSDLNISILSLKDDAGDEVADRGTENGTFTIQEDVPPTITAHSPTGSDVPVDTTITVTFSEAMNKTSAQNAFSTSPSVLGSSSWDGNKMIFTPTSNLDYLTTYTVTIGTGAKDLAGNNLESPFSWQFTTMEEDTTPPVISNVDTSGVTTSSATITWNTNEFADSVVKYGTSPGVYTESASDSSYVTSHSIPLLGLKANTTYYYVVNSTDQAGNPNASGEYNFTTKVAPEEGDVILWDTNKNYTWKGPFSDALADKASWTQVPYGTTDYTWIGDPMIENEHYYLFLFSNDEDSPVLVAKLSDGKHWENEIYKVYRYPSDFGHGAVWTEIIKNTADEVIVKSAGKGASTGLDVTTTYRIPRRAWLEVKPVERVNQQGLHGKTRLCTVPNETGNDFILDSKKHSPALYQPPAGSKMIINLHRMYREIYDEDFMWVLAYPPGVETNSLTYMNLDPENCWEEGGPFSPCIVAQYAYLGDRGVVIGVLNHKDNWKREDVNQYISNGETYTSSFQAPYAGKWRVTARVGENYYSSEVVDISAGDTFTFASPVSGTLDYLVMYMYDRTEATPDNITTPMDVYRETILVSTGTISGTVTNTTGATIEGATVLTNGHSNTTNTTGGYIITNVPVGTYTVTASKKGYQSQSKPAEVTANQTTTIDFQLTTETTPPIITTHTPTGTNVHVGTTIIVIFSEAMNKTSAESAFSISPSVSGSFSWDGNKMIFTPSSNLASNTIYNVSIGTEANDLAGNNLESPFSWQFTTIEQDTTPPSAVTDLATSNPTSNSIKLTWTAPGDDGNTGTASLYDIQYSTSAITEANWNLATQCTDDPTPQVAGSTETFTVIGLSPNTTYYFAIKTADEVPNWSGISNCTNGTTSETPYQYIWLEAENADSLTPDFEIVNSVSASSGKYIWIPEGTGWNPKNGEASYTIHITSPGEYVIWGKVIAATSSDNSFFAQLDEGFESLWCIALSENWQWDAVNHWGSGGEFNPEIDPVIFNLSVGEHTLRIKQREDGTKLDRLLITNDMSYVPAGIEDTTPPASITNLQNNTGTTWINWTWTNPTDADFNHTMVYLDGVWQTNTSNPYYNATELTADTSYEIGTHPVDTNGNVNTTWINQTTKTQAVPNSPPTAFIDSITPDPAEQGTDIVSFTGHGTDTDGSVVAYNWSSSIDGQLSTANSFSKPASELSVGTHTIYFKVQDDDGAWSTEVTEDLTINPESGNPPPVADPNGPYTGTEGVSITFDGSGSYDSDGSIVSYEWDFGDGNTSTGVNPTHTYTQNGTYTIALTVTDDAGATDTNTTTATIADIADTEPTADFSATPTSGLAPLTVAFTDTSTSYDGITAWEWDFDNDSFIDSIAQNPTHEYTEEGKYNVSLTVYESDGGSDTITKTDYITVTAAPDTTPPTISDVSATNITGSTATITWTTDEPSTSQVEYGLTASYGSSTTLDTNLVTSHSQTLTGLDSNTTYHYRVKSKDASNNEAVSGDYTFTTTEETNFVLELHFDEGSGATATDSSGNNNNGTIYGATWILTGKLGSALQFDGENGYIEVLDSDSLNSITDEITLIAWVKTPITRRHSILERWLYDPEPQRAYVVTIEEDGTIQFLLSSDGTFPPAGTGNLVSSGKVPQNTWTHIVVTSNGSTMKIYINGEQDPNTADSPVGEIHPSTTNLHIGVWQWSSTTGNTYFNGTIDEIKIYNRALSAEEIKGDYEAGLEDTTPPLSISDLQNTTGTTWINWTWTNPTDADFNHTMVYLNGVWQTNTSNHYYNATGLVANTSYAIGTHTVDTYGNVNTTWINQTTKTQAVPNSPPTAFIDSITPDPAEQGTDIVSFTGHGTDTDGSVVAYNWSSSIDGLLSTANSFSKPASELSVGTHTIYFKVQDDVGSWSTEVTEDLIIIEPGNQPPVADPNGPYTGTEGVSITFDGSGSYDPDGSITTYEWDFGDGKTSSEVNPTHIYAQNGTYTVTLTVTDDDGATDTNTTTATIADTEPTADFTSTPTNGPEPLTAAFTDTSTSYDGITAWEWDFGNGNTSAEQNPTQVYSEEGNYTVSLTVYESDGGSDTMTKPDYITVTSVNQTEEYIWLEAENADSLTPDFEIANDASASNGKYIQIPEGVGFRASDGEATYNISINSSDNYVIWGRKIAATEGDNSFFVQIDDGTEYLWTISLSNNWQWDEVNHWGSGMEFNPEIDPVIFNLSAGDHILKIKQREDGTKLERLLITNNISYVPVDIEDTTPPASISNLQNITGTTWINLTWNNPPDADFNYTMVYLDGVWQINTSNHYYNATGLNPDTGYEIGTHTVDTYGNVNTTWVNQTTKTVNNSIPRYDVNEDGTVGILDTTIVGQHFGETTRLPYPRYDVNEDGTVDILDTTIVGQHLGEITS